MAKHRVILHGYNMYNTYCIRLTFGEGAGRGGGRGNLEANEVESSNILFNMKVIGMIGYVGTTVTGY